MAKKLLIINGPNLNMLGERKTSHYGNFTLHDVEKHCEEHAKEHGLDCRFFQSNNEAEIIDTIHEAKQDKAIAGVLINAGAYTHTSIAIRDALEILDLPLIEIHISNVHEREEFRHHSYIADIAAEVIAGHGIKSYSLAVDAIAGIIKA